MRCLGEDALVLKAILVNNAFNVKQWLFFSNLELRSHDASTFGNGE